MSATATLDRKATAAFLGMSLARLRRELQAGTVPGPLKLTGRRQLWSRIILERWLAGEASASGGQTDPIMSAIDAALASTERSP